MKDDEGQIKVARNPNKLLLFFFQILRCGPPGMNKAMEANLDALDYSKDMQFQF